MTSRSASHPAAVAAPYLFGSGRRRPDTSVLQTTPDWFSDYVEPQLGNGARAIVTMKHFADHRFLLNSTHSELLVVWQVLLGGSVDGLIDAVAEHTARHDRGHFADVRQWGSTGELASKSVTERAARFIYLSGTASGTAEEGVIDDFASAEYARDTVAFDAANLRALAALLADRDVQLDARPLFDLLPTIHEDDFVFLDRAANISDGRRQREERSFVGSVTAKGAHALLGGHPFGGADGPASWPGVSRFDTGDDQEWWANGTLMRSLRRRAAE